MAYDDHQRKPDSFYGPAPNPDGAIMPGTPAEDIPPPEVPEVPQAPETAADLEAPADPPPDASAPAAESAESAPRSERVAEQHQDKQEDTERTKQAAAAAIREELDEKLAKMSREDLAGVLMAALVERFGEKEDDEDEGEEPGEGEGKGDDAGPDQKEPNLVANLQDQINAGQQGKENRRKQKELKRFNRDRRRDKLPPVDMEQMERIKQGLPADPQPGEGEGVGGRRGGAPGFDPQPLLEALKGLTEQVTDQNRQIAQFLQKLPALIRAELEADGEGDT